MSKIRDKEITLDLNVIKNVEITLKQNDENINIKAFIKENGRDVNLEGFSANILYLTESSKKYERIGTVNGSIVDFLIDSQLTEENGRTKIEIVFRKGITVVTPFVFYLIVDDVFYDNFRGDKK